MWFRYVDETFVLFDDKKSTSQFLQYLNSRHNNIKFTIEFEENGEISFLDDILVKRCPDNAFMTSIYRKKTFTGLYIRTLTYRCFRICSSPTLLQFALSDLQKLLLQNGYPQGIIKYKIDDVLKKIKSRNKLNSPVFTVPRKD